MIAPRIKSLPVLPPTLATPGQVAQALTGRSYLSFSQASTYQACPLKWHFAYIQKAEPERVSAALLVGASIHAAIQRWQEARMAYDPAPSLDDLMDTYWGTWRSQAGDTPVHYGRDDDAEVLGQTARKMLEAFVNSPDAQIAGRLIGIEEPLRVTLDPGLPDLVAKVDLLRLHQGELTVQDFKTARSLWSRQTAEDHAEQLLLYGEAANAIADDLGAKLRLEFLVISKAKKTPKVGTYAIATNPDRVQRSKTILKQVFRAMSLDVVYPNPSVMNCPSCPYQTRCKAWHREAKP